MAKKFTRSEHRSQCRVRIGHLELIFSVQATQHTGRVALAHLLLDAQATILFVEVLDDEVDRRARTRLKPDRAAHAPHIAIVNL